MFADALGGPVRPKWLSEQFARLARKVGLPGTLHVFRHTHATLALVNRVPLHIVASRIGERPETLLHTDAHLLPSTDVEAAEQVAALLLR